jgi:hypothetical protein
MCSIMWDSGRMADTPLPRRGLSLEQRSRLSGISGSAPPTSRGAHRRHCWVLGPDEQRGPWPGLVLQWDRTPHGWRAWVVYLAGEGADQLTVQTWVTRDRLAPAD